MQKINENENLNAMSCFFSVFHCSNSYYKIFSLTNFVNSFMTEAVIIDLLHKSMDWFLYDNDLRHEKVCMKGVHEGC